MHTLIQRSAIPLLLLTFAIMPTACTFEVKQDEGTGLEASVAAMLLRSADAWNSGDLDAFMSVYSSAASTSFMTQDGPVYGRDQIRAGFKSAFTGDAPRDSLRFEDLTVRQLPPMNGIAMGRYILHRDSLITASGWFTIVLRRVGDGWRIVHDHSAASPLPENLDGTESPE